MYNLETWADNEREERGEQGCSQKFVVGSFGGGIKL